MSTSSGEVPHGELPGKVPNDGNGRSIAPDATRLSRLGTYIDEAMDDALAVRARRTHTSKAALIRDAVRRSIGESEPTVDPFRDWISGSEAEPAPVNDIVYGS